MNNQLAFTEQILGNHHITPERNGSVGIAVMKKKLRCHIPVMSEALQTRVEEVVALEMKCPKLSRNGTALKDQLIIFIARLSKTNNANVTQTWSPSGSESGWERPSSACSHGSTSSCCWAMS